MKHNHLPTLAVLGLAFAALVAVIIITQTDATGSAVVKSKFYQEKARVFGLRGAPYATERGQCFTSNSRGCCTQACKKRFGTLYRNKGASQQDFRIDDCIYYCYWGSAK